MGPNNTHQDGTFRVTQVHLIARPVAHSASFRRARRTYLSSPRRIINNHKSASHPCTRQIQQIKAHELLSKSKADLQFQLTDLKQELLQLRVAKITGGNTSNFTKGVSVCSRILTLHSVRRPPIARVLTIINQKQRQNLREPEPARVLQERGFPKDRAPAEEGHPLP